MTQKHPKVSIIGAGNVGATLGFILALKNYPDVCLIDNVEGVAEGKALDIAQSGSIMGFDVEINGSSDFSAIKGSDIVVVTAGFPRKPGMDRIDLLKKNADIIAGIGEYLKKWAPDSIVIVVTNPVDIMSWHLMKLTGFHPSRLMGQAGVLDCARFQHFLSQRLNVARNSVSSVILGGHGNSMVVLPRLTSIEGVPISKNISNDELRDVIERSRSGGEEIVNLLKTGSAYFAPAAATARMVEAIYLDSNSVLVCSAYLNGQYRIEDLYIGVPVRLGRNGVEEIYQIELEKNELEQFQKSALIYKQAIKELENLVPSNFKF